MTAKNRHLSMSFLTPILPTQVQNSSQLRSNPRKTRPRDSPGDVQADGPILPHPPLLNLVYDLHSRGPSPRLTPRSTLHQPQYILVRLGQIPQEARSDFRAQATSEHIPCTCSRQRLRAAYWRIAEARDIKSTSWPRLRAPG